MKLSDKTSKSGSGITRKAPRELGIAALNRVHKPSRLKGLDAKIASTPGRKPADRAAIATPATPRVAVIGLGYWGPNLVRNFYSVLGENLRACCDRQSQRGRFILQNYPGIRFTDDIEVILGDPDIDALAIATPVDTHYPLAKAALTAGKSVLVEKPMCSTVEQAEELVDLADRNGKVLMVDHTFVYNPAVRKMKEVVDSGQLGELLFVDSIRINLGIFQHDVNVVWDLAPHDLSIVQYLVGRPPRSLSAFGAAHAGNGIESIAYINLDFGDGLIANFHVNWLSPVKIRHTVVGGRKRSLIYNDLDPIEKVKIYDSGITVRHDDLEGRRRQLIEYRTGDIWAPHIAQQEPLRTMVTHFIDCLREHKRPVTDGRAGLEIVRILDAAQRSIKAQGGRITL
ncbi:MAG: Gfo/Idh/MocA family oxidoreductase [Phycisphaerae bacterium]|nr:Gfo/Idh/MocA family oxidoreductase [Phycisphaerae bacterium]